MINTAAIRDLCKPGLNTIFGDYPMYPAQWTEIYERHTADKAVEIDVEIKMLGLAQLKNEGANTAYDSMGQRYMTNYVSRYVGLGFIITRQAIRDNLYKSRFPMQAKALRQSFEQTKEVQGAAVLNNGFDTNYPIGDGKPLFSTTHPRDGGTVANKPSVDVDLNETALEDAVIAIQIFRNAAGLRCMTKPMKVLTGVYNQFAIERLMTTKGRVETANNDINALVSTNAFPQGYRINQFFTDADAWYVKTDAPDGFKYFEREPMETSMYTDPDNDNLKVKGIERYAFGVSNFRCAYGSQGQ